MDTHTLSLFIHFLNSENNLHEFSEPSSASEVCVFEEDLRKWTMYSVMFLKWFIAGR